MSLLGRKAGLLGIVLALMLAACGDDETATPLTVIVTATPGPTATPIVVAGTPIVVTATPGPSPTPIRVVVTATPEPKSAAEITIALGQFGADLLPTKSTHFEAINPMYEPLFITDPNPFLTEGKHAYGPAIAQEWSLSGNGSSFNIKLAQGVQTYDGCGEYTAEDVAWAFNEFWGVIQSSWTPRKNWQALGGQVRVVGENEVEMVTAGDPWHHSFFLELTLNQYLPPPKEYIDRVGREKASEEIDCTTGPFRLVGSTPVSLEYEAVRNHYRVTPYTDRLVMQHVPEAAVRLALLNADRAHIAQKVDQVIARNAIDDGHRVLAQSPGNNVRVAFGGADILDPNLRGNDPWMDVRVRKALAHAIDVEAMIDTIGAGFAIWPDTAFSEVGFPADPYRYDPAEAKRLLTEAGYPDGFSVNMPLISIGGNERAGNEHRAVASYFEAIGVDVTIEPVDYTAVWRPKWLGSKGATGGNVWVWGGTAKPIYTEFGRLASTTALYTYWADDTTEVLYQGILDNLGIDDQKAYQSGFELMEYMYDQVLFIPLYAVPYFYVVHKDVESWDGHGYHDTTRYELVRARP